MLFSLDYEHVNQVLTCSYILLPPFLTSFLRIFLKLVLTPPIMQCLPKQLVNNSLSNIIGGKKITDKLVKSRIR